MSLQTLADLSEIAAAIAILVTLVYLAIQVKQARRQISQAGRQARADAARELLASVSDTEYLASIFAKLSDFPWGDFGLESKEDTARFAAWCHAWMRTEEHNYGALSAEERASQDQLLLMWLSTSWGPASGNRSKRSMTRTSRPTWTNSSADCWWTRVLPGIYSRRGRRRPDSLAGCCWGRWRPPRARASFHLPPRFRQGDLTFFIARVKVHRSTHPRVSLSVVQKT